MALTLHRGKEKKGEFPGNIRPENTQALAKQMDLIQKEWWALGQPRWRITCQQPEGVGTGSIRNFGNRFNKSEREERGVPENLWTPADLEADGFKRLKALRVLNQDGFNIYVTPLSPTFTYILIDDLTVEKKAKFLAAGYEPTLILESSAENYQAVLMVPACDKEMANAFFRQMNAEYGDQRISGVEHPFRLASFRNKKPVRENFETVIVLAREAHVCPVASKALLAFAVSATATAKPAAQKKAAAQVVTRSAAVPHKPMPILAEDDLPQDAVDRWNDAYDERSRIAASRDWGIRRRTQDFHVIERLSREGMDSDLVTALVYWLSPKAQSISSRRSREVYAKDAVRFIREENGLAYLSSSDAAAEEEVGPCPVEPSTISSEVQS